jgi:glucokinase
MFDKMKTASSLEKFCKGIGILKLYQFMQREHPDMVTDIQQKIKKTMKSEAKAAKTKRVVSAEMCITYAAVHGLDPLCELTIDFLIEIIASCLQRFTLAALPMGGIYLGGGVLNYLGDYLVKKQEIFWNHYLDHPYMRESILEKVPIYVMRENPTMDSLEVWMSE